MGEPAVLRALVADWPATIAGGRTAGELVAYLVLHARAHRCRLCRRTHYRRQVSLPRGHERLQLRPLDGALSRRGEYVARRSCDGCRSGDLQWRRIRGGTRPDLRRRQPHAVARSDSDTQVVDRECSDGIDALRHRRQHRLRGCGPSPLYPVSIRTGRQPVRRAFGKHHFRSTRQHGRPLAPDLDRFPRYALAAETARSAVLAPGGAIYVPTMWWHHVRSTGLAAIGQSETLRTVLLRYVQTFIVQVAQSTATNAHHRIESRLARWFLMCHDRSDGDEIALTPRIY
ncbi:hypothetical protein QFZ54_003881 [Sphingomonas faeni]|nr:hypothetical protein [Sphingomonas faeni]